MTSSSGGDRPAKPRASTELIHGHRDPRAHNGFINAPAYRGSTVLFPTLAALRARSQPYTYGRRGNPNTVELETQIASLEGGERTILTSSGFQAVTTAILAFVKAGDEILVTDSVYQPARNFCDSVLPRLGVKAIYYDPHIGAGIDRLITDATAIVWTESPGSQTFEVQDIPAIAKAVRERRGRDGLRPVLCLDNTWASPLFFKPFAHGVDVSVQALTKYVVGHSDALLGAVTATGRAVKPLVAAKEAFGLCPGSEETWLALRGLRTLDVRLGRQQTSGLAMAAWLERRPEVAAVLHPGLPGSPGHDIWKRDFLGASSLFAVVLKPLEPSAAGNDRLAAFIDGLTCFGMGFSWGGYESLILPFDPKPYRTATTWPHTGPALRFHIGLEDVADLQADLAAGFERMAAVT